MAARGLLQIGAAELQLFPAAAGDGTRAVRKSDPIAAEIAVDPSMTTSREELEHARSMEHEYYAGNLKRVLIYPNEVPLAKPLFGANAPLECASFPVGVASRRHSDRAAAQEALLATAAVRFGLRDLGAFHVKRGRFYGYVRTEEEVAHFNLVEEYHDGRPTYSLRFAEKSFVPMSVSGMNQNFRINSLCHFGDIAVPNATASDFAFAFDVGKARFSPSVPREQRDTVERDFQAFRGAVNGVLEHWGHPNQDIFTRVLVPRASAPEMVAVLSQYAKRVVCTPMTVAQASLLEQSVLFCAFGAICNLDTRALDLQTYPRTAMAAFYEVARLRPVGGYSISYVQWLRGVLPSDPSSGSDAIAGARWIAYLAALVDFAAACRIAHDPVFPKLLTVFLARSV